MARDDLAVLAQHREKAAAAMTVERIGGPVQPWELTGGELVNTQADFFRVVGLKTPEGPRLLLRQPETALVGLVVTSDPGARRVLVNARAEPGLPGLCQISSTVQSTPANFERRHGGEATPYLAVVLDDGSQARVVYDALQRDWGEYYDRKVKRVRIVEVDEDLPAEYPFAWVSLESLGVLEGHDQAVTIDLRTALLALRAIDAMRVHRADDLQLPQLPPPRDGEGARALALDDGSWWRADEWGLEALDGSRRVDWVRTCSASREVAEWVQPLLALASPEVLRLAVRGEGEAAEIAVSPRSSCGMRGEWAWYPSPVEGGEVVSRVHAAAEGGRFNRHEVSLDLVTGGVVEGATWLSMATAMRLCLEPVVASVELRVLLGLALAREAVR